MGQSDGELGSAKKKSRARARTARKALDHRLGDAPIADDSAVESSKEPTLRYCVFNSI